MASFFFLYIIPSIYGRNVYVTKSKSEVQYVYPKENQTIFYKDITLSWSFENNKTPVTLQISENKDFNQIVIETIVDGTSFKTPNLSKSKEYYWRIISSEQDKYKQYSFFKTTTLKIDYQTPCCLQLIPTDLDGLPLIYIDNPDFKQYTISIDDLDKFERVLEKKSASEFQCIPAYKFPKGRYLIKIKVPQEEKNNISEILMIKDE